MLVASVSVYPYEPCLADSVVFFILFDDDPTVFPFSLPWGNPVSEEKGPNGNLQFGLSLHISSGCWSLHQFPFADGGSLSNDN